MAIFEYRCEPCDLTIEEIRLDGDATPPPCMNCSTPMLKLFSVPFMYVWNQERKFPNVRHEGDGSESFSSDAAYQAHLRENHMGELSTDAPKKTKSMAKVTRF